MPKACGDHASTSLGPSLKEHKPAFLHGYLDVQVIKAKNLKDMETLVSKFGDTNDVTDAFVDIKLGSCSLAKTPTVNNNLNPVWNQTFKLPVCHKADLLVLDVIHEGKIGTGVDDKQVGAVEISPRKLLNGQYHKKIEGWFPIQKGSKVNGELFLSLEYRLASKVEKSFSVESYFPMRQGCDVTLYQDAHCPVNMKHLNLVKGPNNTANSPQSCWKDLYYAIKGAKHICCITGWSVWTKLKLFRGEEAKTIFDGTLGELLVMKANEGVIVQVMLWREISSKILKGVKDNSVASGIINFFSNPTGISGSGDSVADGDLQSI